MAWTEALSHLEKAARDAEPKATVAMQTVELSAAISLKRIADAAEAIANVAQMITHPVYSVNASGGPLQVADEGFVGDVRRIAKTLQQLSDASTLASKPGQFKPQGDPDGKA